MKKTKILTPLLSVTAMGGLILPIASCSCSQEDSTIKESIYFKKEQTIQKSARYILILDKDTYEKKDLTIELLGEGSDKFNVTYFISNNVLVVDVTATEIPLDVQATYTLKLKIKIGDHTKEFSDLVIHVLSESDVPTVNEHLKYKYHGDTNSYYAYCDLSKEERATWNVRALYFDKTYNDGTHGILPITGVEESGFANCTTIQKLIIPENIKYIGVSAFNCSEYSDTEAYSYKCAGQINEIKFLGTSQLETIDDNAFRGQNKLTEITIPKSVKTLGELCFFCLDSEDDKYETCVGSLEKVTFEKGSILQTIGWSCFCGHKNLKSITIPNTVTTIGYYAFCCCDTIGQYEPVNGEKYTHKSVGSLQEVIFQDGSVLETLGYGCFLGQKEIQSINLPNTVTTIESKAFACYDCVYEDNVWNYTACGNISNFNIDINNSQLYLIGEEAFTGQKELTTFNIPETCQSIGVAHVGPSNPFILCSKLKTFNVHDSNTYVKTNEAKDILFAYTDNVFYTGWSLVSYPTATGDVDLSSYDKAEVIGENLFIHNPNITSVKLNNEKTKEITDYAFWDCKNLNKIEIGKNIEQISYRAFLHSSNLVNFIIDSNNQYCKSIDVGSNKPILTIFEGGDQYLFSYPSVTGDMDLTDSKFDSIIGIYDYCFAFTPITSFKANKNFVYLGQNSFYSCLNLKTVNLNMINRSIEYAFENCNIQKIEVDQDNTHFKTLNNGQILFGKDDSALYLYLDGNGKNIDFSTGDLADTKIIEAASFTNYSLDSINLVSLGSIEDIKRFVFNGFTFDNTNITIPTTTKEIQWCVFYETKGLETITFADTDNWKCEDVEIDVTNPKTNLENLTNEQSKWCEWGISKSA